MEQPYNPETTSSVQNLPLFPKKQQTPPAWEPAPPVVPIQHQPYYAPNSAVSIQGSGAHPLQDINIIVPKEPIDVPDYLWFSIFTTLCCCPLLGIAALFFSIRTVDANHDRNSTKARWNSKVASALATIALGIGIVSIVVSSLILVWLHNSGKI